MVIDTARKRIVGFYFLSLDPLRPYPAIQLWYKQVTPGLIHTRGKKYTEWHEDRYESDDHSVSWIKSKGTYLWTRVPSTDVPDWLSEQLDRVHATMDQHPHSADQDS